MHDVRNPKPAPCRHLAKEPDPYVSAKHVRFFELGVLYHITSRTHGNLFLLRPDLKGVLRSVLTGVLAEAKKNWGNIANFGTSAMSNHLHKLLAALAGDPRDISDYIRFVKSELTRRWNKEVGWSGSILGGFECTAIITPAAQVRTLKYVMGQGCQENLVADPREWPGFNCSQSLVSGEPAEGYWFDGTGYGKKLHAEKVKKNPRVVLASEYRYPRAFSFDKLPALDHLSDDAYCGQMLELVEEVVEERERAFTYPPLGAEAVCAMDPKTSRPVPKPPWFEKRKRFIVWDNPQAPEVKAYLERYWNHQVKYREHVRAWINEELEAKDRFPDNCFLPGLRPRPIAHMEQSMG